MFWNIIFPAFSIVTFFLGLVGNGFIAFMFLGDKNKRNVPNTYILSLACANLLLIITRLPMYFLKYLPWGTFFCYISTTIIKIYIGVYAFTLIALSVERYSATIKAIGIFQTRSITIWIIVLIWVVIGILALIANICIVPLEEYMGSCIKLSALYCETSEKVMFATEVLVFCIVPLCAITTSFILITKKSPVVQRPGRVGKPLTRVVLICAIVLFTSLIPYYVILLTLCFQNDFYEEYYDEIWSPFVKVQACLWLFLPCPMPIILYCMGGCNFCYLYCHPPPRTEHAPDIEMASAPLCEEHLH